MVFINGEWYLIKISLTNIFQRLHIIGQWGICHHNRMGGGVVSLERKCNKVQQSWTYLYLRYSCGQVLRNNEEILACRQTFNVKFLGHSSDLFSKWNKMLCLVDGRVVIWIYLQHLKVCCGTYDLSPRFLPHCCIFNFMSVRYGQYLSTLLFSQASEHRGKNVPTPKEKKIRNTEE